MSRHCRMLGILALLGAAVLGTIGGHRTQAASFRTLCVFPSGTDTDGRMLAIAGKNRRTFELQPLRASITVPPGKNVFWLGLFDGETGIDDTGQFNPDLGNWDFVDSLATVVPQLRVRLYADPNGDQSTLTLIAEWFGNQSNVPPSGALWRLVDDDTDRMPNNAWWDVEITTSNLARTSTTSPFRYFLDIQIDDPNTNVDFLSCFKVRAIDADMRILPGLMGLIAPISTQRDRLTLYPGWDGVTLSALVDSNCNPGAPLLNSPYDGSWEFLLDVPASTTLSDMVIWNGDLDHTAEFGFPCITETTTDTDDPDSPPFPTEPWFVPLPTVVAEGAQPGIPADDNASPIVRRHPSVQLQLIDPQGRQFVDPNPSGNQEWEKFHITADPSATLSQADYGPGIPKTPVPPSGALPTGIWKLRIVGLDAHNLVFVSLPFATRCDTIRFPDLGDEVWYDMDRDGIRDWFEQHMGIGGVRLDLFRGSRFLGSTFSDNTGDLGRYFFLFTLAAAFGPGLLSLLLLHSLTHSMAGVDVGIAVPMVWYANSPSKLDNGAASYGGRLHQEAVEVTQYAVSDGCRHGLYVALALKGSAIFR